MGALHWQRQKAYLPAMPPHAGKEGTVSALWIVVNGNRVDIVKKPPVNEDGIRNTPPLERAHKLKEAFEAKGYDVEGPYVPKVGVKCSPE